MDKNYLIGQINVVKNNFVLGIAAATLLTEDRARVHLDSGWIKFDDIKIDFPGLKEWIKDNQKEILNLLSSHFRLLIGDSLEFILAYCGATKQREKLEQKDWYLFAKKLRTIFFHGGKIGCRNHAEEVTWQKVEITKAMNGHYLSYNILPHKIVWFLFTEMEKFVQGELL